MGLSPRHRCVPQHHGDFYQTKAVLISPLPRKGHRRRNQGFNSNHTFPHHFTTQGCSKCFGSLSFEPSPSHAMLIPAGRAVSCSGGAAAPSLGSRGPCSPHTRARPFAGATAPPELLRPIPPRTHPVVPSASLGVIPRGAPALKKTEPHAREGYVGAPRAGMRLVGYASPLPCKPQLLIIPSITSGKTWQVTSDADERQPYEPPELLLLAKAR